MVIPSVNFKNLAYEKELSVINAYKIEGNWRFSPETAVIPHK